MWELDYKESWVLKNWCFWIVVLEKTLENPLDCKEIHAVQPKGDQSWVFTGRTDVEAETPIFGHLMWRDDSFEKTLEKGTTEDEMAGWHHWLDGHVFRWTPGVGDGQGGLACCGSWGCEESDMTEWLNWTELNSMFLEWLNECSFSCFLFHYSFRNHLLESRHLHAYTSQPKCLHTLPALIDWWTFIPSSETEGGRRWGVINWTLCVGEVCNKRLNGTLPQHFYFT